MIKIQLGLIGYPLTHSHSPLIHEKALDSLGLMGKYELFEISNTPEGKNTFLNLLVKLKSGEIQGLNITIPHKQNVLEFLDQLSPSAEAIGAVNTIYIKNNKLYGDNTDAPGFLVSLKSSQLIQENKPKNSIVFGAGGSARAVVYALAKDGWNINLASRRIEQAQELRNSLSLSIPNTTSISIIKLSKGSIENHMEKCQLLVNTTPVGMYPKIEKSPWPSGLDFPPQLNVYDLIYNPKKTLLCKNAETAGARTCGGLGMLIEQAALSFEIWTGKSPDRLILRQSVNTKLEAGL